MAIFRAFFVTTVITSMILVLSSCQPHYPAHLRVASNSWIGYTPLYLAEEMGLFEPFLIKMIEMPSASEVIHALRSGSIEVAALTLDEALTILEDEYDLKVILVMDISDGSDVLLAKPDINSLTELKGKTIAVEYNAVGALLLDHALAAGGITPNDVEILSCNFDSHITCYDKSDALVTFDPVKTKLMKAGAKQLYSSKKMPNVILDVLVTTQEVINEQPKQIQALLNSYFKARTYLDTQTNKAISLIESSLKIPSEELTTAFQGVKLPNLEHNKQLLSGTNATLQATLAELQTIMLERKLLTQKLDTRHLIYPVFLERVDE